MKLALFIPWNRRFVEERANSPQRQIELVLSSATQSIFDRANGQCARETYEPVISKLKPN